MKDFKPSVPVPVCMVKYNGEEYFKESLDSVISPKEKFQEIILVDKASEDESIEIVRKTFPAVKIIVLHSNQKPGTARNVAFKAAACHRILFLDNDVKLTPELPDRFMRALDAHPLAVAAIPRILYNKYKHCIQFDGADCLFLGLMKLHNVNSSLDGFLGKCVR